MAAVVAFLNSKGGPGKTTLATNVGGCLHKRGHSVLIVDSDPQGSARDWYEARREGADLPPVVGVDRPVVHLKALEKGLEQQAAAAQPFGSLPAAKRGESARRFRQRVLPVIHAQIHTRRADAALAQRRSEAAARQRERALQARLGKLERLIRQLRRWKRAALQVLAPEQMTRIMEFPTKGRAPKGPALEH